MNKEISIASQFLPYELSLKLKNIGFNEECAAYYSPMDNKLSNIGIVPISSRVLKAPLWQQAARFLNNISNNQINITINGKDNYEELCEKFKKAIKNFRNL